MLRFYGKKILYQPVNPKPGRLCVHSCQCQHRPNHQRVKPYLAKESRRLSHAEPSPDAEIPGNQHIDVYSHQAKSLQRAARKPHAAKGLVQSKHLLRARKKMHDDHHHHRNNSQ